MKSVSVLLVACIAMLWVSTVHAFDRAAVDALNTQLSKEMQNHHAPAVSYAIFNEDGLLHAEAMGASDVGQQTPATTQTLFRVGSITKTLTAIAIMQLEQQGKLRLDQSVKELLPEAPIVNPFSPSSEVLVVHLLEHTAGFDDMHFKGMYREGEILNAHTTAYAVDPEPLSVRWAPGTMHSYSNPGYGLLGAIIESVSGMSWEVYIRQHVLNPIGMNDSVLTIAEAKERDHARPYSGEKIPAKYSALYLRSAGVLWSTPTDLSHLLRFIMTDGRSAPGVLQPESIVAMKQVHSTRAAKQGLSFGYALGLYQSVVDKRIYLGHNGGITGFVASMAYDPISGIGYTEMHNTDNAGRAFTKPITTFIAQQYPRENAELSTVTPAQELNGWYRLRNSRNELMRMPEWLFGVGSLTVNEKGAIFAPIVNASIALLVNDHEWLANQDDAQWTGKILRKNGVIDAIELDNQYFERVSAMSALAPVLFFGFSLLFLISVPFGRRHILSSPWVRRWPSLALLCFTALIAAFFGLNFEIVATVHVVTVTIFVLSVLLPLLALISVVHSVRTWHLETARVAKWRCALGGISAMYIAVLLSVFHITGLMLWAW